MIQLDVLPASEVAAERAAGPFARARAWRSGDDREGTPAAAALRASEFLPGAVDDAGADGPNRREFLKVMGASMAMAGLAGCRRPVEQVLPYVRKPQDVIEGTPNYFATGFPFRGVLEPLLVESHEGRPTKVEGNPEHPVSRGASSIWAQASLLGLYDPDRSRFVRRVGEQTDWSAFATHARGLAARGAELGPVTVVLAGPSSSPTAARMRRQFEARFPGVRWITLHPHGDDPAAVALGGARPLARLSGADVIVSFDADFLSDGPDAQWNSREYAASRRVDERGSMSRLYVAESTMTATGGMADHRKRLRAVDVPFLAAAVTTAIEGSAPAGAAAAFAGDPWVHAIAEDVRAALGRCAFFAGPTQPPHVHAMVASLNARFGQDVVEYLNTGATPAEPALTQLATAVADMASGRVRLLMALGTNPVYDLPAELNFAEAMGQVPESIHVGLHRDETAALAGWHVPAAHYLEAWGDGRALDGTLSIIQPLIAPLYAAAHSEIEVLNALAGAPATAGYDLVRQTIQSEFGGQVGGGSFEEGWRTALHDGFVPGTAYPAGAAPAAAPALADLQPVPGDAYELVFRTCPKVYDGAYANNAWMQEVPEMVTKVTWDNVALVSPATAEALGLRSSLNGMWHEVDRLRITLGGRSVELPAWIQPGHPDNSVSVSLGYGRELESDREVSDRGLLQRLFDKDIDIYRPGPVANGVGVNVGPLRALASPAVAAGVGLERVADAYRVATTQDHGSMEGRAIVRMATLDEYRAHPGFAQREEEYIDGIPWQQYPPLWGEENNPDSRPAMTEAMYAENQWGMTIDLNACSGCNACVVACQSENNIPVVGKDQVSRGREMHWLRIDRYYLGEEADPSGMVTQVMICQHCENAPCESVCPVAATSHSPDGINEMTYNRCIGTRYCANNCPYKVRRYNFYNWTKALPLEVRMAQQPDVTVRFRGVMEKCTFCVQRVRTAQQYAHVGGTTLADGDVQTACQQSCPTDAIVFGDLRDSSSRVSRLRQNPRAYPLLGELSTRPRVNYLARLRNPSPRLAALEAPAGAAA